MKAIERLYKYLDYQRIKAGTFEKKIGLSQGYLGKMLGRKADMGEGVILQIIENCPDINLLWFLTGNGPMLREEPPETAVPTVVYARDPRDIELIETQRELIALLKRGKGSEVLHSARTADYVSPTGKRQ